MYDKKYYKVVKPIKTEKSFIIKDTILFCYFVNAEAGYFNKIGESSIVCILPLSDIDIYLQEIEIDAKTIITTYHKQIKQDIVDAYYFVYWCLNQLEINPSNDYLIAELLRTKDGRIKAVLENYGIKKL